MCDLSTNGGDRQACGARMGLLLAGAIIVLVLTARSEWDNGWRALLTDEFLKDRFTMEGLVVGAVWSFAEGYIGTNLIAPTHDLPRQPEELN